jgi:opacity protein-like surface antigen
MRYQTSFTTVLFSSFLLFPALLLAEAGNPPSQPPETRSPWSTFSRGGALYQFDTDLDEGGSYSSSRFNIQAGQGYSWDRQTGVSLSLSYSYDDYSFSDITNTGGSNNSYWEDIHSVSLSAPVRLGLDDNWSAFLFPSLRTSGESGAHFSDTITGGMFAGAAYKFGPTLTIGPGLGVMTQLEESPSIFPILIIDWKITDKISLETGRGLAATLGPGLTLNYQANSKWLLGLGGRYEKLRFRLDKNGDNPGGVGEDSAVPLFASCTYNISRKATVSVVAGVELAGELKVEDSKGHTISEDSVDPGLFTGLTFNVRM